MNYREFFFLIPSRFVSGTFLTISKQWDSGDRLSLQLPIHLRTEAIKGEFQAQFTIHFLNKFYLQWNFNKKHDKFVDTLVVDNKPKYFGLW